jgi:hypothetical protein
MDGIGIERTGRMLGVAALWVVSALASAACAPGDDVGPGDGGTTDGRDTAWDPGTPDEGTEVPPTDGWIDDCAAGARWVYLVDSDTTLIRFEPDTLTMTPIGAISCPDTGMGAGPFSMSVDRNATAWVLYGPGLLGGGGGKLYHVSTADASCTATSFVPRQNGFELFGMGFVSDSPGSTAETLFVAGGAELAIGTGYARLGSVDGGSLALTPIGDLPGWPELTGNGAAELWGFFPDTAPPSVQRIDKATGTTDRSFPLTGLNTTSTEAWAFAFWGGDFYIFLKIAADPSTNVWKLETAGGAVTNVMPNTGRRIVGAGVSTCAPLLI